MDANHTVTQRRKHKYWRVAAIPLIYIKILDGDVSAAIILSQIEYWSDKTNDPDGWIYKSHRDWYEETGMKDKRSRGAAYRLEERGLIETKLKKANGAPTLHYRLNSDALDNAIDEFLALESVEDETPDPPFPPKGEIGITQKDQIESPKRVKSLTETTSIDYDIKNRFLDFSKNGDGDCGEIDQSPDALQQESQPAVISREVSQDIQGELLPAGELPEESPPGGGTITGMSDIPGSIADVKPPADDSDPTEVMRWFEEMGAIKSAQREQAGPPRTFQDHRGGVAQALQSWASRSEADIIALTRDGFTEDGARALLDFVSSVPEDLRALAREFCRLFGRAPLAREKKGWISEFRIQADLGISPADLVDAFSEAKKNKLTFKAPQSATATAEKYAKLRKDNGGTLPGERKHRRVEVISRSVYEKKLARGEIDDPRYYEVV